MIGRPRVVLAAVAALALLGAGVALVARGDGQADRAEVVLKPKPRPDTPDVQGKPQVVELGGAGVQPKPGASAEDDAPSAGAPTDAEVRSELREARSELKDFKRHLATAAFLPEGPRAKVLRDGTAQAPEDAPDIVKKVILAANQIAKFPYKWGGGHGAWRDSGYDCSGSVSFALAAAGLVDRPYASGGFIDWGESGPGEWITIYTNPGHMFMVVAGLRFDTSGRGRAGTRWQQAPRGVSGFAVRHYPGL